MSEKHTDPAQSSRTVAWDHPVSLLTMLLLMTLFGLLAHFSFALGWSR